MKIRSFILIALFLDIAGCITQFIPDTDEDQNCLVVEGMITDQFEENTIKLSLSMPLGRQSTVIPMSGCNVSVTDDLGGNWSFFETSTPGIYKSAFQGVIGRKYTLHILTNDPETRNYSYESLPMEMHPVPLIDSIYYEKVKIDERQGNLPPKEGCQIYLDTHDPTGKCKYYRWSYNETWEFRLPFSVPVNNICWISINAGDINIKNTSVMSEDRIERFPLLFISNNTDRLKVKYSILVHQYSLNEDEYEYWEKLQNIEEDVGGLYDIIPSSVQGNIFCVEDPGEKVLGYFSVSAKSTKRIFIKENFSGIINLYRDCIDDTIFEYNPVIPGLNVSKWILEQTYPPQPPLTVITTTRGCADCTERGSITKPEFWDDYK